MIAAGQVFKFPHVRFPARAEVGGYLYIVEFDSGLIKVGMSADPAYRVRTHVGNAERFGLSAVRVWISALHDECLSTEKLVIAVAADLGGKTERREWFTGVNFDEIVEAATVLRVPPVNYEAARVRQERAVALFRKPIEAGLARIEALEARKLLQPTVSVGTAGSGMSAAQIEFMDETRRQLGERLDHLARIYRNDVDETHPSVLTRTCADELLKLISPENLALSLSIAIERLAMSA